MIEVKAVINENNVPVVYFTGPYKQAWKKYKSIAAAKRAVKTTWSNPEKAKQFWLSA